MITRLGRALRLLLSNPRQFMTRLKPYVLSARSGTIDIRGVAFDIDLELDPAMRQMYHGAYQSELIGLMAKLLREGDTFIDVGANVGYISACALGLVGESGQVHAFEPVPRFLDRLRQLAKANPGYRLQVNGVALGEHQGTAKLAVTNLPNIGWNTMVPDFMNRDTIEEEIEVDVVRLGDYLSEMKTPHARLIKIDVEGYEFPVLKGFQEYLRAAETLPIMVIEIAPSAYPKLGVTPSDFAQFMTDLGFIARSIDLVKTVDVGKLDRTTDVAFVPKAVESPTR